MADENEYWRREQQYLRAESEDVQRQLMAGAEVDDDEDEQDDDREQDEPPDDFYDEGPEITEQDDPDEQVNRDQHPVPVETVDARIAEKVLPGTIDKIIKPVETSQPVKVKTGAKPKRKSVKVVRVSKSGIKRPAVKKSKKKKR